MIFYLLGIQSILGFVPQQALDHRLAVFWNFDALWKLNFARIELQGARDHFVQDNSDCPLVNSLRKTRDFALFLHPSNFENLRGLVRPCAESRTHLIIGGVESGQAKVNNLQSAIFQNHDVLRFQIAVNNFILFALKEEECLCELSKVKLGYSFLQLSFFL